MSQWGKTDAADSSPLHAPANFNKTQTRANANTLFGNTTLGGYVADQVVGVYGVDTTETAVTRRGQHAGWVVRKQGTGPIETISISNVGANFANNETFVVSGGSVNAVANVTTNATGNITSLTITNYGRGFQVNSTGGANVTVAPQREKHLMNISVTGGSGYSNTDVIQAGNGTINGTATITTNSTGGFANADITLTNVGLWGNAKTNAHVSFLVVNTTGGNSAGTGATLVANLATSTDGAATVTLGGRANRISMETLVAMGTITSDASDDTQFPDS